jgi:trimeric autotransporter adhesin
VPAVNVKPAAQINCIITNTAKPATVVIRKTTTGAPGGPFNFSVSNLAAAPAAITTTTAGTPAPAAPTAITVSALNAIIQISEGTNSFFTISGATCTDANAAVTGNPASFGTLTGQLIAIPAANVLPAAQIICTFTNAGNAPKIRLSASGRLSATDQFRLAVTGTGAPAAVNTTGTLAAITSAPISFTATANAAYSMTETMATGSASLLTAYAQTVACSNANGTGTNVTGLNSIPINFTALAGDDISCTITNSGSPTPRLTITKSFSTGSTPVSLGQSVTYTYTVANTGNVTITNVQISDMHGTPPAVIPVGGTGIKGEILTVPGPLGAAASPDATTNNGIWSTLAPGATIQFNYVHTVTQAEIDNG